MHQLNTLQVISSEEKNCVPGLNHWDPSTLLTVVFAAIILVHIELFCSLDQKADGFILWFLNPRGFILWFLNLVSNNIRKK